MAAASYRRILATKLTTNFRDACKIVNVKHEPLGEKEVLIRNRFVGINATDINVTAGRYSPGQKPPLDTGLEGIGKIIEVGKAVPPDLKGKVAGYIYNGSFAECTKIPVNAALILPEENPIYIPLLISGLTAFIALETLGNLQPGETVLITAAAGGTGHLAVQLAKLAGCHVIGLCSSQDKADFLKQLGCDRVIDYGVEDLGTVLKDEYPRGLDVVYESIGGSVFETCLNRVGVGGRIISLGFISSYHSPGGVDRNARHATIIQKLILKSASVRGFFLMNHAKLYKTYLTELLKMVDNGSLKAHTEILPFSGPATGLEGIFDGVDFLYGRKSKGKVIVDLGEHQKASL